MKRLNVLLLLCACFAISNANAQGTIRIGDISSMSGPLAIAGVPGRQGAILAVEQINKAGGVLGRQIELVKRDDKTQPEEAGKLFSELGAQNVLVVIGSTGSGTSKAMNARAKELKLPFFTIGESADVEKLVEHDATILEEIDKVCDALTELELGVMEDIEDSRKGLNMIRIGVSNARSQFGERISFIKGIK